MDLNGTYIPGTKYEGTLKQVRETRGPTLFFD